MLAVRAGRRPLVVELGEHGSSAHSPGGVAFGYDPVEIMDGVHATRVLFEPALVDYVAARLKLRAVARLVTKNNSLKRLFLAAPGVDEIVTMHRVAELANGGHWGPVLVDLESTGNALMFFDLPGVLDAFLRDGPLRQVVDSATQLLHDPDQSVVHIVTVPEPLVVRETIDFYREARDRKRVHLGRLFINRVPPRWLDESSRQRVLAFVRDHSESSADISSLAVASHLIRRRETAERCIDGLRHDIDLPTTLHEVMHATSAEIVERISRDLERSIIQ